MKFVFYSILSVLIFTQTTLAKQFESVETYQNSFAITRTSTCLIQHKLGNIIISNWNKDSISVKLIVKIKSRKKEIADKYLKSISSRIIQNMDSISIVTLFNEEWKNHKKIDFEITYLIQSPAYLNYDISNKWGDLSLAKATGKLNIHLHHGKLTAQELRFSNNQELNQIKLDYSTAQINYCNYASIDIKYGDFKLNEGKALKLDAIYTTVNIDKLQAIYFSGKYGSFSLDTAEIVNIDAKYLSANIQYLNRKLISKIRYGGLHVDNISPFFSTIDIEASFGNTQLLIHPDAVYKINAEIEHGSLDLPKKANIDRNVTNKGESTTEIIGPLSKPRTGEVNIDVDYGNVKL